MQECKGLHYFQLAETMQENNALRLRVKIAPFWAHSLQNNPDVISMPLIGSLPLQISSHYNLIYYAKQLSRLHQLV